MGLWQHELYRRKISELIKYIHVQVLPNLTLLLNTSAYKNIYLKKIEQQVISAYGIHCTYREVTGEDIGVVLADVNNDIYDGP